MEEDIKLFSDIIKLNGKRKWVSLSKIYKGRTENSLKNRFSLMIEKEKQLNPSISDEKELTILVYERLIKEK